MTFALQKMYGRMKTDQAQREKENAEAKDAVRHARKEMEHVQNELKKERELVSFVYFRFEIDRHPRKTEAVNK